MSVVVATHNRRDKLERCLASLRNQTLDATKFEVVVADDGSSDESAAVAEAFEAPYRLRVLRLEKSGHAAAQNATLGLLGSPRCLLLDDDMVASPGLVESHAAAHRANPTCIGIGAITQAPPDGRDWYAHTHARSWNAHYKEFAHRPAHWTDCYGANLSMSLEKLLEVGGVSTEVPTGKDLDLGYRLSRVGCKPTYLPEAHGTHDDQKRRQRMLEDAARQGAMHLELSRRDPERIADLLDWSARSGPKEMTLRRLFVAMRVPPTPLALAGPLVPGPERELLWYSIVRRFAFWRGVRKEASREEWGRIVTQVAAPVASSAESDLFERDAA